MKGNFLIKLNNVSLSLASGTGIFKKKKQTDILRNISFELLKGESIGIIGRNGAGKSTLLRVICGVLLPTAGEILNNSKNPMMLTLNPGSEQFASAYDNVIYSGILLGYDKELVLNTVNDIFKYANLIGYEETLLKNYSTGMRARLGFALAVKFPTDLLIIDETLSVGDALFRAKSKASITEKISNGITSIIASHNNNDILELCTKAIWVEKGIVKLFGDSKTVVDEYNRFIIENENINI
jgi:ABC-type polysaccharide/polyol phosphate transport system ATPase subunit